MRRIILILMILLIPTMLYAEQIGIKVGGMSFDNFNGGYLVNGAEIDLDYWTPNLQFQFVMEDTQGDFSLFSLTPGLKYNFPSNTLSPYIGGGIGLFIVDNKYSATGRALSAGIEPKLTDRISLFIELKFNFVRIKSIDYSGKSICWGLRWLL